MNNKFFDRADEWYLEEWSDLEAAAASKASSEVYVVFSVYDWSGALVYWAGTSEAESKKAWSERSLDFFDYGPDDVSNLIYARFSEVPIDVINGVCSKDRDTANCYLRILFGADPAEAADSDPKWDPDGCPFPVDILGEHNGLDAYYDLAALGYDVDNIENWPDNKFRDLIAKHHLNESDGHNKVLTEDDDISEYRIVKVSYCSDDYDINVEFGIIDPDEEEYDVVDEEWLLKPGQTMEDLENYLYDKVGVTNLDMGDPEVITPGEAGTTYRYSQKF